jgi:uncharacterized protein YhfF
VAGQPADESARFLEAFHFDDHEASADTLARLVIAGRKRATASLLWAREADHAPVPRPGHLSVVMDFAGRPACIIETTSVLIVPFVEVDANFARLEGEGDGSLAHWRDTHWAFFSHEGARIGRAPSLEMPVICERFETVYCSL